ncbi:MAG: LysM peptidoglycan-binding domain-containing protein [Lentisphaeria bacterium]|nr:LysM peptidoglycan-binding domain-containing protein [Victivallales bacterium]MCR4573038.1 LysM peptidoglycan-binding domain-containing protein [Lentisphaeria bacterium]
MKKALFGGLLLVMLVGGAAYGQDMRSIIREMAQVRADMRVLQEDQKILLNRIEAMGQENMAKDAQITELQKMLTMQETRIQAFEREMMGRLEQLRKALEGEQIARRKDLESAIGAMATEISKLDRAAAAAAAARNQPPPPPPAYTGSYKEIVVQAGDTLSMIATTVGVPISTLRQLNNLKSDRIFVGQKLKIPVVQK